MTHTVQLPSVLDGPRPLTRRDLRRIRAHHSWAAWALLTLRLKLRGQL